MQELREWTVDRPRELEEDVKGMIVVSTNGTNVVALSPAFNTRTRTRPITITQETVNAVLNKSSCCVKSAKLAGRKYPLKLLCDFAGAVMDQETRELIEYWNLMKKSQILGSVEYFSGQ